MPTTWEVRTGGNAANGGGFLTGGSGTDYSKQNSAQVAYTDLVIDATTNTNATSVATPFTSNHVGNWLNFTGGTGFTVQRARIVSVAAGVATFDRSLGTLSSTGGTGNLGGALAGPEDADASYGAGDVVNIASGNYTKTSTRTLTCDGTLAGGNISFIGYLAGGSPADADVTEASMPVFTSATNSVAIFTTNNANFLRFRNIKITHTAGTRGVGFTNATAATTNGTRFENCIMDGCLWAVDFGNGGSSTSNQGCEFYTCKALNGTAGGFRLLGNTASTIVMNCYFKANAGPGISLGTTSVNVVGDIIGCVFNGQTGASGHGVLVACTTATTLPAAIRIIGNDFYNNAQSGLRFEYTTGRGTGHTVVNNSFVNNGAYGVSCATAGILDGTQVVCRSNAFYNNTSGARQNFQTGEGDITLTGVPFTNAGSDDFTLDNTASEGAAMRSVAWPNRVGAVGATAGTNYGDVGPLQVQPSAGGGTVAYGFAG